MQKLKLVLASTSPTRSKLLHSAGYTFEVVPSPADENIVTLSEAGSFENFVLQKAVVKANGVVPLHPDALVLGCDTVITCNGKIYEKPKSYEECMRFLCDFSGSTCVAVTGASLRGPGISHDFISSAEIDFRYISEVEAAAYAATPEAYDKSGGFSCLGHAARWIRAVRGDYCAILGLPLCGFAAALEKLAISV